jgi:hypothetical protein
MDSIRYFFAVLTLSACRWASWARTSSWPSPFPPST